MKSDFVVEYIGVVHSCYPDKFGTPRQPSLVPDSTAVIELYSQFQPEEALSGLDGFSHLWIIFHFHKNTSSRYHPKVHPPRLRGESMGVFATRSPHRPNPIGLSLVELVRIDGRFLHIRGIDLIEGTPVLDIKPYLPEIESKASARSGWSSEIQEKKIEFVWNEHLLEKIHRWSQKLSMPNLKCLIEQTLQLDPRPQVYKGYEGQESPYRNKHAVRFFDGDIHFEFLTAEKIVIHEVLYQEGNE